MPANEKFQAGELYDDVSNNPSNLPSDPLSLAKRLLKDYVAVRGEASLPELLGIVKDLVNEGEPIDDRKNTTEILIGILAALPPTSSIRTQLTHKLIGKLWSDLEHPPLKYYGSDAQYSLASSDATPKAQAREEYDVVEFDVPDNGTRIRQGIPPAPDGLHGYRMPDGRSNNVLHHHLGAAGSAYAKSVRSEKRLHGVKPDAGLLFDLLMARDESKFKENPAGISSMLFYHASVIIHDIFRTSRTNMSKSDTSSYLDLAPLYGSSLRDQVKVRTMKEGKLKPDTFHEKRLLGQPAGVNVMLVLWNRFHNYVADMLLKINENGRFSLTCKPDANGEEMGKALAKQDHDLFNTARLVTCGMYASVALGDYLRAIINLHSSKTEWAMDPRVEIGKGDGNEPVERGVGNQVSVEFNLLYRFHSCISKKDERWMNDFFLKLFPDRNVDDLEEVSLQDLGKALLEFEQGIPVEPSERTFDGLQRQKDGRFKDEDLVRILKEAMDDPAGAFGARMVPKALKVVEVLGINQARAWNVASLNEFRSFFGLKPYDNFSQINSDADIAKMLENLYSDPDMVELYPGLMIEDTKPVHSPGMGICPTYTVGRAVLADAIALVRSDRFLTVDFTVSSLTAWGYNEIQGDTKTLGGSMLYKLIQRGVPGWFPFNSIAVMQPMYTKKANEAIAKKLGTIDQYTLDDPKPPPRPVFIVSSEGIKHVLDNPKAFPLGWGKALNLIFPGKKDLGWFMLSGDEARNYEHKEKTKQAMSKIPNLRDAVRDMVERVGAELIDKASFQLKEGLHQLDIIRDVAVPLNAQILADLFSLDLKTDENPEGVFTHAELYRHLLNVRIWGSNNTDPAEAWNRRRRCQESCQIIIDSTRKLVDEIAKGRGLGIGITSKISEVVSRKRHLKKGSLRECGYKLVEELLSQGKGAENVTDQLWLMAFGGTGFLATTFYQVMDFFLQSKNASIWDQVQTLAQENKDDEIQAYVTEAQRITEPLLIVRYAAKEDEIEGKTIKPGDLILLMIADAGRNIADGDKFDAHREQPQVGTYSTGQHACLGKHIALTFVSALVKVVAGLKELRPAPGAMGQVKRVQVGQTKMFLNDSWSYLAFYANTWKVHYSGHGKGTFANGEPKEKTNMEQYYHEIEKRKSQLLGNRIGKLGR